MTAKKLTHLKPSGEARMVDVTDKQVTSREARARGAEVPGSRRCGTGAGELVEPAQRLLQDKTAPVEPVDSTGVPGRSCPWIPIGWERVSNVFSFRLQHLRCTTGIPHHPRALQIVCNTSQTIVCPNRQTSVERFSFWSFGAGAGRQTFGSR